MTAGQITGIILGSLTILAGLSLVGYAWWKLAHLTIRTTSSQIWVDIKEVLEEFVRTHGF